MTRAQICVTFDNMGNAAAVGEGKADGPDPDEPGLAVGYPRLLDLLDLLNLRATFFVEGWNGVHHPERVAELAARGHEVGLHGWVHEPWGELDRGEAGALLDRGCEALRGAGVEPVGFRAPGGRRGPHTAQLLAERRFRFDASLPDDGEPSTPHVLPEGIAQVPFAWRGVDGFYYLGQDASPASVEAAFHGVVDRAIDETGFATIICHAFLSAVDDTRFDALRRVLERVAGDPEVEPVTAGAVADAVLRRSPPAGRAPG